MSTNGRHERGEGAAAEGLTGNDEKEVKGKDRAVYMSLSGYAA